MITGPRGDSSRRAISIRDSGIAKRRGWSASVEGDLLHPRNSQRLDPRSHIDVFVPRIPTHSTHRDLPRWRRSHHRRALEIRSNQFRPNEKPSPFPPSSPPVRPDSHDVVLESVCNSVPRSLFHFKRSPVTRHTHKRFVRPEPAKGRAKGEEGARRGTLVDIELKQRYYGDQGSIAGGAFPDGSRV